MLFWACALVIISAYGASAKLSDHFAILPENFLAKADGNSDGSARNPNEPYCYHFTWMGHNFDNRTFWRIDNKTCDQFSSEIGAKPKPMCADPMVATYEGRQPNITHIYEHYGSEDGALCRLSEDSVCAKYSVYFGGVLTNVTRLCTRINVAFETSMESGCITDDRGTYKIEVCACRSVPGKEPCNSSHRSLISFHLLLLILVITLYSIRRNRFNI